MRDYKSGKWGFGLVWGYKASVFPNAVVMAVPNCILTFFLAHWRMSAYEGRAPPEFRIDAKPVSDAIVLLSAFTTVMFFILQFRSNVAYARWWEGGTLLQKTRGEWFNSYSSLIAFSSPDPAQSANVEEMHHLLARLMSLLFCCALQQVSPDRSRPFEIIDLCGIDSFSLDFLTSTADKVEVLMQWIQRTTILKMKSGLLPIPPPVMSRAFQEISRGIVNLQNARKIADFPFPFPYAQTSMVMLLLHWAACPILCSFMVPHTVIAAGISFLVITFLWCINYIALQLEQPFGSDDNDLPMDMMQTDWNKSLGTLLMRYAQIPPPFEFDGPRHRKLEVVMSDGSPALHSRMTLPGGMFMSRLSSILDIVHDAEPSNKVKV